MGTESDHFLIKILDQAKKNSLAEFFFCIDSEANHIQYSECQPVLPAPKDPKRNRSRKTSLSGQM